VVAVLDAVEHWKLSQRTEPSTRMDAKNSFNLEIRIVAANTRDRWYWSSKIVDADFTNFKDLVDEVVEKCPPRFGDIVRLFYFCMDSKVNIQVCSDQNLFAMFDKHEASKCCLLTFSYHSPSSEPHVIPDWDFSTGQSIEAPFTSFIPCPSIAESSLQTQTQSTDNGNLANPNPCNEHLGDEEWLYIELDPQPPKSFNSEPSTKQR